MRKKQPAFCPIFKSKPQLKKRRRHGSALHQSDFPPPVFKLQPIYLRRDSVGFLLLFIGAFALFAVSAARTIVLEDDGLFVSAAWFAGVVHPPGYPLYTMLGWLSSHLLPFGEIPWRVHILSGFMGSVTCSCIAFIVLRRTGNRPAAYLSGAALAVSEHFWSQAIIADVYTTNTALLFLSLIMAQEAVARQQARLWVGAAFLYGLGLANHWPLLLLGSPLFIAYALASGKAFWGKLHYLILTALIPAILLYGWLAWRSHQAPPINFLGAIDSLSDMIAFIRRDIFAAADVQITAGFMDKVYYGRYFITEALLQFSLPGGIVVLWGILHSFRHGWRAGCYGEIGAMLSSSLLLIGLLGFDYDYFRVAVFRPYPLVAYCLLAVWLGLGIDVLMQATGQVISKWQKLSAQIICASFGLVIIALGISNGRTNYRANDRFAEQRAQILFDLVEQGAIVVPHGDASVFPAVYYHLVEGRRPDIRLLEPNGFFLNDRVVQPLWSKQRKSIGWRTFVSETNRPFYHQSLGPDLTNQSGQSNSGFVVKTNSSVAPAQVKVEVNGAAKAFFKKMLALPSTRDRWITHHRNLAIKTYGEYLGYAIAVNHPATNDHIKDAVPLAENNYWSLMGMVTMLLAQNGNKHLPRAEKYLEQAKRLESDQSGKLEQASLLYFEGKIAAKKGESAKAENLFKKSLNLNPAKNSPARKALQKL